MKTARKTTPQTEEDAPISSYNPTDKNFQQPNDPAAFAADEDLEEVEGDFEGSVADDEALFDKDEEDETDDEEEDELEVDEIELDEEEIDEDDEEDEEEDEEAEDDETKDQTV